MLLTEEQNKVKITRNINTNNNNMLKSTIKHNDSTNIKAK